MADKKSWFTTSEYTYDVFLSFRGEDTREIFTTRLYSALVESGFGTFIDDNGIERGEDIKTELTRAIHHSRGSIVVFSENYANSGWCLDELVMIADNKYRKGHVTLPIFYHVFPSQVGRQVGSFAKAFEEHEKRAMGEKDEKKKLELLNNIQKWRDALTAVAAEGGMMLRVQDSEDEGYQTRFIQKTVEVIKDKLNRAVLTGAQEFVGIGSRVKEINAWLHNESPKAEILVICGQGGIGKTTIAKFVYLHNYRQFDTSSFVPGVREISEQPNGLVRLQRELLSDILGIEPKGLDSVDQGIERTKAAVARKRMLLVLDDVDQVGQLNAILGMRDWLLRGSKIIITTRQESWLNPNEVYKVHRIQPLDYDESVQLFSWYAFGQDCPPQDYMDFSDFVINKCNGLPLALKVFGSSVVGKSQLEWLSTLRKLKEVPSNQIQKLLRVSYDTLPDNEDKDLFLHICCFFVGKDKDYVVGILDECGFQTMVGIQTLINRSLLTIDLNLLRMHRSIQDVGIAVVRDESPGRPENRSRLWHYKDSLNVLKFKAGTEATVGLLLDMKFQLRDSGISVDDNDLSMSKAFDLETDSFKKMENLVLLQLDYVYLNGSFLYFPKNLKWLRWHGFPLKSLPNSFPMDALVALDMSHSRLLKFWKKNKIARFLKVLDLSHSHMLLKTPDFSGFPNLESLILKDCISLSVVHKSLACLDKLMLLDLQDCRSLSKLPKTIVVLKHLEKLILAGCTNLHRLPPEMNKMRALKVLNADGIAENKLLFSREDAESSNSRIRTWLLKPRKVEQFTWASLPHSLVSLSLANCKLSEDMFPDNIGNFTSLRELNLSRNPLRGLPKFVSKLSKLQTLQLESCRRLQSVLDLPDVQFLRVPDCRLLETVTHLSNSSKLHNISSSNCGNLTQIQGLFYFQPLGKFAAEMLNNLGLFNLESLNNVEVNFQDGITFSTEKRPAQLLYEFGIFSSSIPGSKLPDGLGHEIIGPSISFTVPSTSEVLQMQGLNLYFVYALSTSNSDETWFPEYILFIKITNKTKDLKWIYYPTCFGIPEPDQELLWLSHWTFRDQLEIGDEVDISIISGDNIEIKECGVSFLYHEQEKKVRETYLSWREVIGGDLSAFRLSTGAYYLCRTSFLRVYEEEEVTSADDWTTTSWGRRVFGGPIDFNEIRIMNWMGRHNQRSS